MLLTSEHLILDVKEVLRVIFPLIYSVVSTKQYSLMILLYVPGNTRSEKV